MELKISRINGMWQADYMFADIAVSICSIYKDIHIMCADYRTGKNPLFRIITSKNEIKQEKDRNENGSLFDDAYIETLLVYRKLALELMNHDILLIHGSAISLDNEGYIFTALSGTGKSTHTRLWREAFGDRVQMINDDKPLLYIGKEDEHPIVYGTPWDGKHHLSNNVAVPLKAIVYLERGQENEIHEVTPQQIFPILLQQTFRETDMVTTTKTLELLSRLSQKTKFYDLHCNMDKEAAFVAYNGINH